MPPGTWRFADFRVPTRSAYWTSDMTDTCPTWPRLLAWPENDLSDEESQLLNTHVADCDECREKLALMSVVQDVVAH